MPVMSQTDLLTLAQIARRIPGSRGAKRLHPATITRWILRGTKSASGSVVRLKATRVGYRWLVRESDLDEYFTVLSVTSEVPAVPPARTPTTRRKASEAAAEELKKEGA